MASGNDVIVQVKTNQLSLFEDCKNLFKFQKRKMKASPIENEKQHGRIETRQTFVVYSPIFSEVNAEKWSAVKAAIKVRRTRTYNKLKAKITTTEESYYISTKCLSPSEFASAIRKHWAIENTNHYVRDTAFMEDASRIRIKPLIFAIIRSFAFNILRASKVPNITQALYINSMSLHKMMKMVNDCQN